MTPPGLLAGCRTPAGAYVVGAYAGLYLSALAVRLAVEVHKITKENGS